MIADPIDLAYQSVTRQPARAALRFAIPLVGILAVCLAYPDITRSIGATWANSATFSHGFLIIPISLFVLFTRMPALLQIRLNPDWRAIPLLVLFAAAEFVFSNASILVLQQLALLGMVWTFAWLIAGATYWREAWFPITYLLFCIPVGESVVPQLMSITADATITLVDWWGIPVYREGLTFSIPGGRFEVARACSGIRYMIASIALGTVFAYFAYSQNSRRLIFVMFSLLVPMAANALRAFLIVLIAWYSDMQLATGIDHLLYGWVFFGIVLAIMFSVGFRFVESGNRGSSTEHEEVAADHNALSVTAAFPTAIVVGLATMLAASHADELMLANQQPVPDSEPIMIPAALPGWSTAEPYVGWEPVAAGAQQFIKVGYRTNQSEKATLMVAFYPTQQQGSELVGFRNSFGTGTIVLDENIVTIDTSGGSAPVRRAWLEQSGRRLRVHYWYLVAGHPDVRTWRVKLRQILGGIRSAHTPGHLIIVVTPWSGLDASGPGPDSDLVRDSYEVINTCLTAPTPSACRGTS